MSACRIAFAGCLLNRNDRHSLLKVHGKMTTVGLPDDPFSVAGFAFASNGGEWRVPLCAVSSELISLLSPLIVAAFGGS